MAEENAVEAKTEADQAYSDKTFVDVWTTTIGGETIRWKKSIAHAAEAQMKKKTGTVER